MNATSTVPEGAPDMDGRTGRVEEIDLSSSMLPHTFFIHHHRSPSVRRRLLPRTISCHGASPSLSRIGLACMNPPPEV